MRKKHCVKTVIINGAALMLILMLMYHAIPSDDSNIGQSFSIQNIDNAVIRSSQNEAIDKDNTLDIQKEDAGNQINENDKDLEIIHYERRTTLIKECKGKEFTYVGQNGESIVRNHFVYDTKHKIVYCAMEKIGSTFWRRLFQIIVGASEKKSPFDIAPVAALGGGVKTFAKRSFDHIFSVLQTSTKFLFTRDPYLRLLSGYVDKLFSPNPTFWKSIGTYAIRTHRRNATTLSKKCGHDLTFAEFVKYFIDSEENNFKRDGHFIPMYDHCRPCQVKYDIIGKMESFEEDTLFILDKLGLKELRNRLSDDFRNQTNIDSFKDQSNHVIGSGGTECLSSYEKQKRMWRKMQIRGTISKHSKFPFTKKKSNKLTSNDYYKALLLAVGDAKDPEVAQKYRMEAVREAYSTVSYDDMHKLHRIFKPDCAVFSYRCDIDDYKPADGKVIKPFYFDISEA